MIETKELILREGIVQAFHFHLRSPLFYVIIYVYTQIACLEGQLRVMVGPLALCIPRWPMLDQCWVMVVPLVLGTQRWANVHLTHFYSSTDVSWEYNIGPTMI